MGKLSAFEDTVTTYKKSKEKVDQYTNVICCNKEEIIKNCEENLCWILWPNNRINFLLKHLFNIHETNDIINHKESILTGSSLSRETWSNLDPRSIFYCLKKILKFRLKRKYKLKLEIFQKKKMMLSTLHQSIGLNTVCRGKKIILLKIC